MPAPSKSGGASVIEVMRSSRLSRLLAPSADRPIDCNDGSEGSQAAVDDEGGSGDVAGGGAGQEDDGGREFFRVAGAAGGQARQLAVDVAVGELVCHLRREIARGHGDHANALAPGPLDGKVTR